MSGASADAAWLPLHIHMADSAEIAGLLWDAWVPRTVRELITDGVGDQASARTLVRWLAACHDLGKATPAFAVQVPALADRMHDSGLPMPASIPDRAQLPHALASQLILERWLRDCHGWTLAGARSYALVPGSHHGVPPSSASIDANRTRPALLGQGAEWLSVQHELVEHATRITAAEVEFPRWEARPLQQTVEVLLTGIVILADWIASSTDHFPLTTARDSPSAALAAWASLALPPGWMPTGFKAESLPAVFAQRFGLGEDAKPRPLQAATVELAGQATVPSLLIIEAPMGQGKTEASLLAVEIFAARFGARGCFYALPTMSTSDAMFPRLHSWIDQVPDTRGAGVPQSMFLAHSKAQLNETFHGLAKIRAVNGIGDVLPHRGPGRNTAGADGAAVAHEWLSGRKKGVLANFVVGTIDQLLFAALQAKHLALRHLGLANKVVVIDEVHASDEYMRIYLNRALRWLGAYRVPTILLSATLTPEARTEFVEAYVGTTTQKPHQDENGSPLSGRSKGSRNRPAPLAETSRWPALLADHSYPLLSQVSVNGQLSFARPHSDAAPLAVTVERMPDDDVSLVALLREALAGGGSVAVIRNTVARAQATADLLAATFPQATVKLAHSRFIAVDRSQNERELLAALGPRASEPAAVRFGDQPFILVGTQVLEQSIDIDVDLMVSDLAPMDLLLQRMGRLHRHQRGNRAQALAGPRFVITGVDDWHSTPPTINKASAAIYGEYRLLRTLLAWGGDETPQTSISLPDEIAQLVRAAVGSDYVVNELWGPALAEARLRWEREIAEKTARARTFLLRAPDRSPTVLDWLSENTHDVDDDSPEGQKQVRDTEDSIEVLVIQKHGDEHRVLDWVAEHGGKVLTTTAEPPYPLALAVANCSIRLPPKLCSPWAIGETIRRLESDGFAAWQQQSLLKGQLILVLDENLEAQLGAIRVRYDRQRGMSEVHDG